MTTRRELLNFALSKDLASFIRRTFQTVAPGAPYLSNWHIDLIADRLAKVAEGRIRRLVITLPPRHLKSICASVAFPAFLLGCDPSLKLICASYSMDLAVKHARDFRGVLASPWYQDVFPRTRVDPQKNTEVEIGTTARGFRLCTSVGGTLTGRGGDILIIDDPLKADDAYSEPARKAVVDWYRSVALSRLDDKAKGAVVIVMQRLHADDLAGVLRAQGGDWEFLNLPAIAPADERFQLDGGVVVGRRAGEALHPERESLETLIRIRSDLGSLVFEAQYQQNPLSLDGGLIKWAWLKTYRFRPERQNGDMIIQSWDTASKANQLSDYCVCTTWLRRGADHHLLDLYRERLEFPALKRKVVELAARWSADAVLIEEKGSGTSLIQELEAAEPPLRAIAIVPEKDKVTRMAAQSVKFEAGYVFIPVDAPWLDELQRELLQFPHGRHDDQVDSISQYLGWGSYGAADLSGARMAPRSFLDELASNLGFS